MEAATNVISVANTYTDLAGNAGTAKDSGNYAVDTKAAIAFTTTMGGTDSYVNAAEAGAVSISGTASGIEVGRTVTLTFTDSVGGTVTAAAQVDTGGVWTAAPANLSGLKEGSLTLKAEVSDVAGNTATATGTAAVKDTDAQINFVTIQDSAALGGSDNYINNADLTGALRTVTGSVKDTSGALTVEADQTVTVVLKDAAGYTQNATATVKADGTWTTAAVDFSSFDQGTVTATASVADKAGNTATTGDTTQKDTLKPVPGVPVSEQIKAPATAGGIEYFENLAANTRVGTVSIADDTSAGYSSGIKTVEWDSTVGTAAQRSWFAVDAAGNITLTATGAAGTMNDYDDAGGINTLTLRLKVTDNAGNIAYKDITFDVRNIIGLEMLDDEMNSTLGVDYHGKTTSTNPYLTTAQADKILIGYDEYGVTNTGSGNAQNGAAGCMPILQTLGGNDYVQLKGDMRQDGTVDLGAGNDEFVVNELKGASGDSSGTVFGGAGDDIYRIGTLNGGNIFDDGLVHKSSGGYHTGSLGSGNDKVYVSGNVIDDSRVYLGEGADEIHVAGYVSAGDFQLGDGADKLIVHGTINNAKKIDLGANNDTFIFGGSDISWVIVDGGTGFDTLKLIGTGGTQNIWMNDLKGFEKVDLLEAGKQTVTIQASDLLANHDGSNRLYITGNTDDRVDLPTTTIARTDSFEGETYNVYSITYNTVNYEVWVDNTNGPQVI